MTAIRVCIFSKEDGKNEKVIGRPHPKTIEWDGILVIGKRIGPSTRTAGGTILSLGVWLLWPRMIRTTD